MDVVRDGPEAIRETFCIRHPIANGVVPVLACSVISCLGIPTGIQPEGFGIQTEHPCALYQSNGILGSHASIFVAGGWVTPVETSEHGVPGGLVINLP